MSAPTPLIEPTVASAASPAVRLSSDESAYGVTIVQTGLSGSEKVRVQYSVDDGENWHDYYAGGSLVTLEAGNCAETLWTRFTFRVVKDASASSAAVHLFYRRQG